MANQPRRTIAPRSVRSGVYRSGLTVAAQRRFADSIPPPAPTTFQIRVLPQAQARAGVYRGRGGTRILRRIAVRDGVASPPAASPLAGWLLLLGVGA